MPEIDWQFTLVLITNGVMIGLMYTLIALGFVLVYKATDAINFAQGEFVMFAGFIAAAGAYFGGLPFWLCALLAVAGMIAFGFGLERIVLRPLIGRPVVAVIMATIGVAVLLRGFSTLVFGAGTRAIVMPVGDEPLFLGPVMLPPVELVGASVSLAFLAVFSWFFVRSRMGIAMRAVADSQQVAMAMGINVQRYFGLAWAMAGIVSALGGYPGRARFGDRRGRRRFNRGRGRKLGRRLSRPVRRWRHQGFCPVHPDDRRLDDSAIRHLWQEAHRAHLIARIPEHTDLRSVPHPGR
jgi:branched-chain amino acid transport system permease protein